MTTETQTTPGPWHTLSGGKRINITNSVGPHWASDEHYVGIVNKRDAALIAAAPQTRADLDALLAAAKAMAEDWIGRSPESFGESLRALREAVEQAEGGAA